MSGRKQKCRYGHRCKVTKYKSVGGYYIEFRKCMDCDYSKKRKTVLGGSAENELDKKAQ